ncbi:MAG: class I SAM-dependent methyltransferase [Bryobacteraceae bacterium]
MTAIGASCCFDAIAEKYDDLWSHTGAGYWQRRAVWDAVHPLFRSGDHVLDVGCGTGVDALSLMASGVNVRAVDASREMVNVACSKGVLAVRLAAEQLDQLGDSFDGAISNFGVLNCVADFEMLVPQLARLVKRGGHLAICYMGKFCAWETAYYLRSAQIQKATRRWSRKAVPTSLGVHVHYPSVSTVTLAFQPEFRLQNWRGIGVFVPPSYVSGLDPAWMACLAGIDRRVARTPLLRAVADHRLLIFERV